MKDREHKTLANKSETLKTFIEEIIDSFEQTNGIYVTGITYSKEKYVELYFQHIGTF